MYSGIRLAAYNSLLSLSLSTNIRTVLIKRTCAAQLLSVNQATFLVVVLYLRANHHLYVSCPPLKTN